MGSVPSTELGDTVASSHRKPPCNSSGKFRLVNSHSLARTMVTSAANLECLEDDISFQLIDTTVDGQNPAPPRMMIIPLFIGV